MQTETNTTIASRWYEEVFNAGKLELIDELFAPSFVDHDPSNLLPGLEGVRQLVSMYRGTFPDLHLTIEDEITEGDKVVTRFTGRGTHKGSLMASLPPVNVLPSPPSTFCASRMAGSRNTGATRACWV